MELKVLNEQGQAAETLQASDVLFGRDFNEALIHQVVVAYMANARAGNRAQKGRAEIAKSTHKPWRQKGTGRARSGMASSPIWRGGGKTFPSSPDENFSHKVNRKMYRAGVASILSQLAREDRLAVVDTFTVDSPKTKLLNQKLRGMGMDSVLVITDQMDENLLLSSRNLANVLVLDVAETDPVSLVRFPRVLVTKAALAKMEEVWQ
jgi:large subunit ribosomal protein L4